MKEAQQQKTEYYIHDALASDIQDSDAMLFYSFFKTQVGQQVTVELKNDLAIQGVVESVDQFLNIKLRDIRVVDPERYPHMLSVKNCFIRGSVVRYVQLSPATVDTALLQDAARREAQPVAAPARA
ncbi:U6 snRNA-associated Sm-like protein LSm2 [Coemansia javaensis]|uniref:U6 snRNA-associated Sm-like protein LSm2 n=1 Tax=Coemansia javaensis TaxID=2761396 RepID=A0A9W8HGW0_9FUNG|nr:U6 snRNA-associated Sm-like protein LSm2 [Coemansia javaensis]